MRDGPYVLQKVVQILDAMRNSSLGLTVGDVTRELKCNKSTASRLLAAMARQGLLRHDPVTSRYFLGFKLLKLSDALLAQLDVRRVARPQMERVWTATGETVTLRLRVGGNQVCIDGINSRAAIRINTQLGEPFPLHSSASGKAILAFLPDDEVRGIVEAQPLERFTPYTIVEPHRLSEELRAIRARGYATSVQERVPGQVSISAPVFDSSLQPIAALAISGTLAVATLDEFCKYADLLKEAAMLICIQLGCESECLPASLVTGRVAAPTG